MWMGKYLSPPAMPNEPFFKPLSEVVTRLGGRPRPKYNDSDLVSAVDAMPAAPAPSESAQDEPKPKSARLSNPRWEAEKVGFNEEAAISVDVELPPEVAHKKRVAFELFAQTPKGPERISQGDAMAEDGKATFKIPVYIPNYRDEAGDPLRTVEYYFVARHSEAEPLDASKTPKQVDEMADRVLETHILQNVTFATGKSFIRTSEAGDLKALGVAVRDWKAKHADGKLAVFGHADAVGDEPSNKQLSERRAKSVQAYLAKDPKPWEELYGEEKWGLAVVQELLKNLGHDPGALDGQDGPKTQAAVKAFQGKKGLGATGFTDEKTREALFLAYFESCGSPASKAKDFDALDGKAYTGCGEFNLIEKAEGACEANRRVAVLLLKVSKNFPIHYPCKQGSIFPCQKQAGLKGERRTEGFKCRFYDGLVVEKKGAGPGAKAIKSFSWEKQKVIAWNKIPGESAGTKLLLETSGLTGSAKAELEVFQFSGAGDHVSVQKYPGLRIEGNKLFSEPGKETVIHFDWHTSIYDHLGSQYFCVLRSEGLEATSELSKNGLLHLVHLDSLVANPSGDLDGAEEEGAWFKTHMESQGPWMEAVEKKLVTDGHIVDKKGAVTIAEMSRILEGTRFLHHQSSHGTAYCTCDGNKNYVQETTVKGADGQNDFACPVCGKSAQAIGCIFLQDQDNLYFVENVAALKHGPKTLFFANCCLTAITDTFPRAWNKKGIRWYIGWGLPVGDEDAVKCAKAFYNRWFKHYKMDPDKVGDAFNDIKGPYAEYRPRVFGH
jgi:outer membrane protein OmpA-like peptidoglycan-associated protein